ncbi:3-oxoacyl-[acyl-carrier protein] reductase [Scopulibacillus darangshiensis]|uniref:3-oxoacyl-[acyl-carrier protein] reductase n=1 Tax=Scopulibacillus darangshiensis TaxID=442528 RepID=A0A4R2PD26_9BACL|nr:SDR family oxidoreductase [Scopulibacillus darangshiensis]TCP32304.1 3-oxoacyl-[acyl-carrier protein] reductase [Scopulibacillus darangshiensis]
MDLGLSGKNALVMASSQGLGKAIAKELVKEGANVMIAARREERLKAVQDELSRDGQGKVAFCRADVKNEEDLRALVQETIHQFGSIDILLNNAGGPPAGGFSEVTDQDWQHAFELNLLSYVRMIREVVPSMKENGGGRIINITSSSIKQPIPNLILSNTFRLGIVGMAKTLAEELAPDNILIHTVAPGRIATDRVTHLDQDKADRTGRTLADIREESEQQIPLGRYGQPEEFAKVVTFLASDACTYMTGDAFLIDGGLIRSI